MEPTPNPSPALPPMRQFPQPQVGPPVPPGVGGPPTPVLAAKVIASESNGDGKTIDEASGAAAVHLSFWQQPFAQKVMPIVSSVLIHAAIILIGWLLIDTIQKSKESTKEQFIIPEAAISDSPEGGILHPGINGDNTRDAAQDLVPVDTQGISQKNSESLAADLGGGAGESASDPLKAGPLSDMSKGRNAGVGTGEGVGGGTGEGGGPMAPLGAPGGGSGIGAKTKFVGVAGGHANRIVFVLDATGSMYIEFDDLRTQVNRAIDTLNPPQSFNIVFINENNPEPPSPGLMFVTPDNKAKAKTYVEKAVPHGTTDPLPALKRAFDMKPDLIYFLIDPADFPDKPAVISLVHARAGEGKVKMNIIGFKTRDPDNEAFLTKLATETGGVFKFVSVKDLQEAN